VRASTHLGVFFLLLLHDLCSYMRVCDVAVPASCCKEALRRVASLTSCRCTGPRPPRTCMCCCFIVLCLFVFVWFVCALTSVGQFARCAVVLAAGERRAAEIRPTSVHVRTGFCVSLFVCLWLSASLLGDKTNMHDWFAGKSILSSPRMERYSFCLSSLVCVLMVVVSCSNRSHPSNQVGVNLF
jgi:hypothetical protein